MSLASCRRAVSANSSKLVYRPICRCKDIRSQGPSRRSASVLAGSELSTSVDAPSTSNPDAQDAVLREGIQKDLGEFAKDMQSVESGKENALQIPMISGDDKFSRRTVVVLRPDENIRSMPMALSILQEAEARFGKAVEFRFPRDKEVPAIYQSYFWANFEGAGHDPLPSSFPTSTPTVDVMKMQLDGNIGLDDILPYLRDKQPAKSDEPSPSLESQDEISPASTEGSGPEHDQLVSSSSSSTVEPVAEEAISENEDGNETSLRQETESDAENDPLSSVNRIVHTRLDPKINGKWPIVNYTSRHYMKTRDVTTSKAFIQWGGFYPYDYSNVTGDKGIHIISSRIGSDVGGFDLSPEFDPEVTRADKHRWRVKEATNAMAQAVRSHRILLRDKGVDDHGLVKVGNEWRIKELVDPPEVHDPVVSGDPQSLPVLPREDTSSPEDAFALTPDPDSLGPIAPSTSQASSSPVNTPVVPGKEVMAAKQSIPSSSLGSEAPITKVKRARKRHLKNTASTATVSSDPSSTVSSQESINQSSSSSQEDVRQKLWNFVRQVWR